MKAEQEAAGPAADLALPPFNGPAAAAATASSLLNYKDDDLLF